MANKKNLTLVEVAKSPSLFRKRQAGDTLHFGPNEEISVRVEALTYLQFKHVQASSSDGEAAMFETLLAFGIKDITGLTDEDGAAIPYRTRKFNLGGRSFDVCHYELIDGIHGAALEACADRIIELTTETLADAERLGFTKQSAGNAANVVPDGSDPATSADSSGTAPPAA